MKSTCLHGAMVDCGSGQAHLAWLVTTRSLTNWPKLQLLQQEKHEKCNKKVEKCSCLRVAAGKFNNSGFGSKTVEWDKAN